MVKITSYTKSSTLDAKGWFPPQISCSLAERVHTICGDLEDFKEEIHGGPLKDGASALSVLQQAH